ncbi:MAG: hypothetical protein AB7E47_02760 [Desulfovibrionaceae bacterium]
MDRATLLAIAIRQPLGEVLDLPLAELPDWEASAVRTLEHLKPKHNR